MSRVETSVLNEHNMVKNASWQEANQLAIYKCGRGFEIGTTEKQIQVVVIDLNPEPLDCESDMLTTRPCCLCNM